FRSELQNHLDNDPKNWLQENFHLDEAIAGNLLETFKAQLEHSGSIATDRLIVAEHFIDVSGEPLLLIQAPFGARVNGLWAIALAGILENAAGLQVQYTFDDDAFIIRLLDAENSKVLDNILKSAAEQIEDILLNKLIDSPIFAVHFRYNAARALMLPRSQPRKRIPLWLQRLRAADLLQAVRNIPNFPIIAETYRELLYDHFDWPALQKVLQSIDNHDIIIKHIHTSQPSPTSSGLLFRMIADNMYEYDRSRKSAEGGINFTELLAGIISREHVPQIVTAELNALFTARQQYLSPDTHIRDTEEFFEMIARLGPLNLDEIILRAGDNSQKFVTELKSQNRIIEMHQPVSGWLVTEQSEYYNIPFSDSGLQFHLSKILQNNGILDIEEISAKCFSDPSLIQPLLDKMASEQDVVKGRLLKDDERIYYCDRYNFAHLYRQAISERRNISQALSREVFENFIMSWHFLSEPAHSIHNIIDRYQGCQLPAGFFSRNILSSRISGINLTDAFFDACTKGEVILSIEKPQNSIQTLERIIKRGSANYFDIINKNTDTFNPEAETILQFLKENGASFFSDIVDATELGAIAVQKQLTHLVQAGEITNDDYTALHSVINGKKSEPSSAVSSLSGIRSQRRPSRGNVMRSFMERDKLRNGRWFLTRSFAVSGKKRNRDEQAEYQARMLLNRYGIVVKEWYRHETGLLPWIHIFNALKKLEWQGEIYRGYFVKGLSGLQFALPEALQKLEMSRSIKNFTALLSTVDPALPFGKAVNWNIADSRGNDIRIIRRENNYLFIRNGRHRLYSESNFTRIFSCRDFMINDFSVFISRLKSWFKHQQSQDLRKIEIKLFDNKATAESPVADILLQNGFEKNGDELVLWPSAV
ncbi:MAG: hypothetical protein H6627_13775, partial [Calditrichae bacterium]|nr:hypothetical protein [Calditrichia bacterium]